MDRPMMLLRLGYYCGAASRLLNDKSHAIRVLGRAEQITEADYLEIKTKIEADLVEAGHLQAGVDLYDRDLKESHE